jgi:hypothetical protein
MTTEAKELDRTELEQRVKRMYEVAFSARSETNRSQKYGVTSISLLAVRDRL